MGSGGRCTGLRWRGMCRFSRAALTPPHRHEQAGFASHGTFSNAFLSNADMLAQLAIWIEFRRCCPFPRTVERPSQRCPGFPGPRPEHFPVRSAPARTPTRTPMTVSSQDGRAGVRAGAASGQRIWPSLPVIPSSPDLFRRSPPAQVVEDEYQVGPTWPNVNVVPTTGDEDVTVPGLTETIDATRENGCWKRCHALA